jgi:serine/threonine protein phosphatase 1
MYPDEISGPVVCVADLHGESEQLRRLLDFLRANRLHEGRTVIFLGDYCDCGPDTAGTIDLLLNWRKRHRPTVFLAGNHDLNLAKALGLVASPHQDYYAARLPTRNSETLSSYEAKGGDELLAKMPPRHKDFFANLAWVAEHQDFIFVHAGLDDREPVEQQLAKLRARDAKLFKPLWLHETALAWTIPPDTNKTIVSGHTTIERPIVTNRRILIDTGCGRGGPLTAILLPERLLIQVPALLIVPRRAGGLINAVTSTNP